MTEESLFTNEITEMTGYYFLPPVGIYIIADHPRAEELKAKNPELPCLTLAELDAMPRLPDPPLVHNKPTKS